MNKAVLLDTSFFLSFLNETDPLFENADGYYKYLIQEKYDLVISTISIAEYCQEGDISDLPLRNLQILPFNLNHVERSGEFGRMAFQARKDKIDYEKGTLFPPRTGIWSAADLQAYIDYHYCPDPESYDRTKLLFSQADSEEYIKYYLSSDSESYKVYNNLAYYIGLDFEFVDLNIKHTQTFGSNGLTTV